MNETGGLFDVNCMVGHRGPRQPGDYVTADGLLSEMDHSGIRAALVFHSLARSYNAEVGNKRLVEEIRGQHRLYPCWVILPPHSGEMPPPIELVVQMRAHQVRAARIFPRHIGPLRELLFGELFAALAEQRTPLIVDYELEHYSSQLALIDWDGLQWALAGYPDLPFILPRIGLALDRLLLPLMERYPNLYVETSYYNGHGGLKRLCDAVGPERLLFGTGMPAYAPGPAITLLTYSGLDEEAERLIGGKNLARLLGLEGKA